LIAYAAIKAGQGKWRDIHLALWPVVILFTAYFAISPIERLLGV